MGGRHSWSKSQTAGFNSCISVFKVQRPQNNFKFRQLFCWLRHCKHIWKWFCRCGVTRCLLPGRLSQSPCLIPLKKKRFHCIFHQLVSHPVYLICALLLRLSMGKLEPIQQSDSCCWTITGDLIKLSHSQEKKAHNHHNLWNLDSFAEHHFPQDGDCGTSPGDEILKWNSWLFTMCAGMLSLKTREGVKPKYEAWGGGVPHTQWPWNPNELLVIGWREWSFPFLNLSNCFLLREEETSALRG